MDPKEAIHDTTAIKENCEVQTNSKDDVTIPKPMSEVLKKAYRKRKMYSKDGTAGVTNETTKDDCTKRKMHPKDSVDNMSIDKNKVLINVNHPDDEPDIYLNSQIAAIVKPHQIDGIRFIFHKIIESLIKFQTSQSDSDKATKKSLC